MTHPARAPHPDWLYHRMAVEGTEPEVARFCAVASGTGIIPWETDYARAEEDIFVRLMASPGRARRGIGAAGARRMAGRLRETVERQHQRALAATARCCPFDLHALLPVPPDILALGADDDAARAWLWEHWGTSEALRHVAALPSDPAALHVAFWSADWTPWRALRSLEREWPDLRFAVRPVYRL
jgi:hypothetical protein